MHFVHDAIEPAEGELAWLRFERIPGKVAHAHNIEPRTLHDGNVPVDLFRGAVDGLIAGSNEQLPRAGPIGM
jgi:hypothetical protein